MNPLVDVIGKVCKLLLPIPEEIYLGNPNSPIAVCTLSSIDLLKQLSASEIMHDVALVGRLLSENKGIDSLINYVIKNPKISTIIVCGNDVWGHKAGHSLCALHNNGMSSHSKRITGSHSPDPVLTVTLDDVMQFQKQVIIIDKIGEQDHKKITKLVKSLV